MGIKQLKDQLLTVLFESYLQNGGSILDVSDIIHAGNEDPLEVGKYFVNHGWVKNHQYIPNGFRATISFMGISEIRQDWIDDKVNKVVKSLGENNNTDGIMNILQFENTKYQIAFDIGKYLEQLGYVTLTPAHSDIRATLTLEGKEYYEEIK